MGVCMNYKKLLELYNSLNDKPLHEQEDPYKDLASVDENGLTWVPSTINVEDKGMIFIQGKSINDWNWVACPAKELTEEEKQNFPEDATYKMDMKNASYFKEREFIEAMDYIGMFKTIK